VRAGWWLFGEGGEDEEDVEDSLVFMAFTRNRREITIRIKTAAIPGPANEKKKNALRAMGGE
jgi:hypothetical protein